jgi:hypothetical protein
VRLITVIADPEDLIPELDEHNNTASKAYQIGEPPTIPARIVVTGSVPPELEIGKLGLVSGLATYEIPVPDQPPYQHPVEGGSVTVVITSPAGGEVYRHEGSYTDTEGRFGVYFPVPGLAGDQFDLTLTVTDETLTGMLCTSFRVIAPAPPPPPPPPSPPGGPTTDLWIHSEDIAFSDWNPDLGEEITVGGVIHAHPDNAETPENVPVSIYAHHPIAGMYQIGPTFHVPEMPPGASRSIVTTWRNAAEGVYIIEVTIGPDFSDSSDGNNAATRALVVGELNWNLTVHADRRPRGHAYRRRPADTGGAVQRRIHRIRGSTAPLRSCERPLRFPVAAAERHTGASGHRGPRPSRSRRRAPQWSGLNLGKGDGRRRANPCGARGARPGTRRRGCRHHRGQQRTAAGRHPR